MSARAISRGAVAIAVLLLCVAADMVPALALSDGSSPRHHKHHHHRRGFNISEDGTTLLQDGRPTRIVSGSAHYFRDLPSRWPRRMAQLRHAGLTAVQSYVAWNVHCPDEPGVCDFSTGNRNVARFLADAAAASLLVLLRPGPFICAEWDFGGFPAWLVRDNASIALRTSDPVYMGFVRAWYAQLLPIVRPFMYHHGGPVAMVQVENEYGSAGVDDKLYLEQLADMFGRGLCGPDGASSVWDTQPGDRFLCVGKIVLYSTDGEWASNFARTAITGVFQAVDFFYYGVTDLNVSAAWQAQHSQMAPRKGVSRPGPNFNDEFYPGWLTHWGDNGMIHTPTAFVLSMLQQMLVGPKASTSSVNFYMFFGGTNYGFYAGSWCVTSYDYDAPISEDGEVTPKYHAVHHALKSLVHHGSGHRPPLPTPMAPQDYGNVTFSAWSSLADMRVLEWLASGVFEHAGSPRSMEQMGQSYGYTAYSVPVHGNASAVHLGDVRDYAMVFVDGVYRGALVKGFNASLVLSNDTTNVPYVERLLLIIDNFGRRNCCRNLSAHARKGLVQPVVLDIVASNGTVTPTNAAAYMAFTLPMSYDPYVARTPFDASGVPDASNVPVIFRGTLVADPAHMPANASSGTFLDMRGWGKGQVYVNGHNLGRYAGVLGGPQFSLYCPPEFLVADNATANEIIVVEQAYWPGSNSGVFPTVSLSATNFNIVASAEESRKRNAVSKPAH